MSLAALRLYHSRAPWASAIFLGPNGEGSYLKDVGTGRSVFDRHESHSVPAPLRRTSVGYWDNS